MKKILLVVILLLSSCAFRMKHRWENGFTCRCKGSVLTGAGATCECEPTKISQCSKSEPKESKKK